MYSSDTDARYHVNRHILRRITYVTCQTSHTYNTLPVLFSNLLPSSRVVAQISPLLATLSYENQQYIKGSIVFMAKKSLPPTFEYSWGGGVTSNEDYVSITYVTLKAPGSEKKHLLSFSSSELTCNLSATKLQILYYYQEIQKKYIMCFNFVLSCNTFGLV